MYVYLNNKFPIDFNFILGISPLSFTTITSCTQIYDYLHQTYYFECDITYCGYTHNKLKAHFYLVTHVRWLFEYRQPHLNYEYLFSNVFEFVLFKLGCVWEKNSRKRTQVQKSFVFQMRLSVSITEKIISLLNTDNMSLPGQRCR